MKHPDAHFGPGELLQITGMDDTTYPILNDGVVLVLAIGPVTCPSAFRYMTVLYQGCIKRNWSAMEEDWGNDMVRL